MEGEKDGKVGQDEGRKRMGATVEDDRGYMDEQTMDIGLTNNR
jgi:hypothetical protein